MLYDEILNPILPNPRISTQRYVPVGLLTLPKTFAESPYAAFAGLANDNAAAPCAGTKRNAPSMSVVSAGDHIGRARDARETTTGDGSMDDAWRDATARDRSVRARRHRRRHRVRKRARKRATTRADIFTRIYHARVVARATLARVANDDARTIRSDRSDRRDIPSSPHRTYREQAQRFATRRCVGGAGARARRRRRRRARGRGAAARLERRARGEGGQGRGGHARARAGMAIATARAIVCCAVHSFGF